MAMSSEDERCFPGLAGTINNDESSLVGVTPVQHEDRYEKPKSQLAIGAPRPATDGIYTATFLQHDQNYT